MAATALQNLFLNDKTEKYKLLIHGLENCRTDVVLVGMKTLVSLYISIICTSLLGE